MRQKILRLQIWKQKPFYYFTALFLLFFIILIGYLLKPNQVFVFSGKEIFEFGDFVGEKVLYSDISLPPGSYRIELEYETSVDQVALCNIRDASVFTGGLLCDGEYLYSTQTVTTLDAWLYERADNIQVVLDYGGIGTLRTANLTIRETDKMCTMLISLWFLGLCAGYIFIFFYYYDKVFTINITYKETLFWLTIVVFISSLPYLNGNNIVGVYLNDYLQRFSELKEGLLGNILLYIPGVLYSLGFTVTLSYNIFCIILTAVTVWVSFICLYGIFKNHYIGIVGSALYTLSIYRIYQLVTNAALNEVGSLIFIPVLLYGLYRVFTEDLDSRQYKTCWVLLMIGYAGLIQMGIMSIEIAIFVTSILCVLNIRKLMNGRVWYELFKGIASAVVLNGWYLFPLKDYFARDVHMNEMVNASIQGKGLLITQIASHFWNQEAIGRFEPVGVGFVLVIVFVFFLIMWFGGKLPNENSMNFMKGIAILGIILLWMSTNKFPWDHIQAVHPLIAAAVKVIRSPEYFLGWGTICLIVTFGALLKLFQRKEIKIYWLLIVIALVGVTTSGMYLLDTVKAENEVVELYGKSSVHLEDSYK